MTELNELNDYIKKEKNIDNVMTFNNLLDLFFNEDLKDDRLEMYNSYMIAHGLSTLSEAKLQIIRVVFSEYIHHALNDYQKLVESYSNINDEISQQEISEINKQIKNIAKISGIFKEYDDINFNSYILNSVDGINTDEIIAIFDKVQMSCVDIKIINDSIKKVLQENKQHSIENFSKDFINHDLTDLFVLPRKKSHIFSPENFNRYSSLAHAIAKHKIAENIEGFDGGISYLIGLDLVFGLNNLKNSDNPNYKKISGLLLKAEENKFDNYSLKELTHEAVKQSQNIKENQKGHYVSVNNSGNTLRLVGPADRIFNFNDLIRIFLHTVSGNCENENNQVGRIQQIYDNSENSTQHSIQIGTRPPIDRKLNNFSDDVVISRREQVLLSQMRNFSYMTQLIANGKKDISILNTSPLELWASSLQASKNYSNDYLNSIDKINDVGNSWFYLIDKYKLLEQGISTNSQDPKHEHVINPMLSFAKAVIKLNKKNSHYQQLTSNIFHVLKDCEHIFSNGNPSVYDSYESLMEKLNDLNDDGKILEKDFNSLDLVNDPYIYNDNPICEIVLSDNNVEIKLIEFFEKNQHSLTLDKMTDLDLEALRNLDDTILQKIISNVRQLALSDIQSIYETEAAQSKIETIKDIIDIICDKEKENRIFCGGTNPNYDSPAQIKFTTMCNTINNGRNRDIVEILGKTSFITNAELHSQYIYKVNIEQNVNEQFGFIKSKSITI